MKSDLKERGCAGSGSGAGSIGRKRNVSRTLIVIALVTVLVCTPSLGILAGFGTPSVPGAGGIGGDSSTPGEFDMSGASGAFSGFGAGTDGAAYAAETQAYGTYEITANLTGTDYVEDIIDAWYIAQGYVSAPQTSPSNYSGVGKLTVTGPMREWDFTFIRTYLTGLQELDISQATPAAPLNARYPANAFNNMNLQKARIPANIPLGQSMFQSCDDLSTLSLGAQAYTDNVIDLTGYTANSYGDYAFYITGATSARLPANVQIGVSMFSGCDNLTTLAIGSNAFTTGVIDFTGYTPAKFGVAAFSGSNRITKVRMPAGVPFSTFMFLNSPNLTTLVCGGAAFEEGVIDLRGYTASSYGEKPFTFTGRSAANATGIRLRADLPLVSSMFDNINANTAITVGSGSLTPGVLDLTGYTAGSYGSRCFEGANGVKIRVPAGVPLSTQMFYRVNNITIAAGTTPFSDGVVDLSAYTGGTYGDTLFWESRVTKVRLPVNIVLSDGMFYECEQLRTLSLGAQAFTENVIDLRGYTPSHYEDSVFRSTKIEKARIPANVPISERMFSNANIGQGALKSLVIGSAEFTENVVDLTGYTATSYGEGAFHSIGATKVRVPAGVPLSERMFNSCRSLTTFMCGTAPFVDGVFDLTGYTATSYGKAVFANSNIDSSANKRVCLKSSVPVSEEMFWANKNVTSYSFYGGKTAPSVGARAFFDPATTGTVFYPQGATGYEPSTFAEGKLAAWTFTPSADLVVADDGTDNGSGNGGNGDGNGNGNGGDKGGTGGKGDGDKDGGGNQQDKPTQYTVTFNAGGGKVGTVSRRVAAGAVVGALPVPTRANYTFLGWYTAVSGGSKISASTPVKANVTYWAQWQANNTLQSIKPGKGALAPAFSAGKTNYKLKLTKKQASIKLTFAKIAKAAKVQIKIGKGKWKTATKATVKVAKGKKVTVLIKVTIKGMTAKTYKIVVSRGK